MKRWFIPSWNGDVRLVAADADDSKCGQTRMTVEKPTEHEKTVLRSMADVFVNRGWIKDAKIVTNLCDATNASIVIDGPIADVGLAASRILKPDLATVTALTIAGGKMDVIDTHMIKDDQVVELAKTSETAATVSRPTPCCPDCYVDANAKATDVLLSFLSITQHTTWARDRYIIVRGGLTGHRYMLAHRNSALAAKNSRICYDIDDGEVIHFHDHSVPPEEEVLAAMIILRHREPWLRNEATCFEGTPTDVFKNPFGDILDGRTDAVLCEALGLSLMHMMGQPMRGDTAMILGTHVGSMFEPSVF